LEEKDIFWKRTKSNSRCTKRAFVQGLTKKKWCQVFR